MSVDGMVSTESNGILLYRWKVFESWKSLFTAALTTRVGGVSTGHLASLNLGHASEDLKDNLSANRKMVENTLSLPGYSWSVARQVHGCRIAAAECGETAPHPQTDALEVSRSGIIGAVMLADCHPIIVYDPSRNTAIVCHAGWRGTAAGMAEAAVERMLESGSRLGDLVAATGPGIGSCCYQVGEDVKTAFGDYGDCSDEVFLPDPGGFPDKCRLDLEAANIYRLRQAGIREDQLGRGGFCTACRLREFYSHRKEKGLTGRYNALVALSS